MKRLLSIFYVFMLYKVSFGVEGTTFDMTTIDASINQVQRNIDWLWTLIAAFLVFFMQLGFAMVESGFTRSKNALNIIMKNLIDFAAGALGFWAVGFAIMFGATKTGFFGTEGFFLSNWDITNFDNGGNWTLAFWIFQVVFCATAATIVSGAIAERANFKFYIFFSFLMSMIIYPVFGSWAWGSLFHGNGWLENLGFIDFAGSTVVHSIGGWAALAAVIVLGPRIGKYGPKGQIRVIPGHNIPLAALGVFILWFGWYGFNVGSETAADNLLPLIAVNTTLAPSTAVLSAMTVTYLKYKKFDIGMSLNGALAGLVGITAGCANVTPFFAVVIGLVAGVIVVYSVIFFDKIKIDDPVGAISVHGVNGAWGTLAAGLFNYNFETHSLEPVILPQIAGIVSAFAWGFISTFVLIKLLNIFIKFRATEEEEMMGLDLFEHGANAYPEFQKTFIR